MTWTRRRWLSAVTLSTFAAALRVRRAQAAAPAPRVEYQTRWIGHF